MVRCWSSCLTCKAGLGAHELGIERRPVFGHGQLLRCFVLGCGPHHPQAWISDKECFKPRRGVRIRFVVLCFLFLSALCRLFRDRWLLHAEESFHASLALNRVGACVCVFYLLSAQRLYPTKPWPRVSGICTGDNAPHKLAAKPGLVQVLCVSIKQVGSGLDGLTEIYFHLWRTWLVTM